MTEHRRIALSTGVTLNVVLAGEAATPPVILLHGFPESHRTWRAVAPLLADRFRLIMPDQRGFGASDRPQEVAAYRADALVEDLFALAGALGLERFALIGHDWGGAVAWAAALRGDKRLVRLGIVNSPHPVIFQKSLIEDSAQRAASQYITAFRNPGFEQAVAALGFDAFFDKSFAAHIDLADIPADERARYIADWSRPGALTAMLNWYRASQIVVPGANMTVPVPEWVLGAFPGVRIPTLVVWGMRDKALLPVQLDGLDRLVDDLAIVRLPSAGHFAPWEAGDDVASSLAPFLAGMGAATARRA